MTHIFFIFNYEIKKVQTMNIKFSVFFPTNI